MEGCVFCDLANLRGAEVYFENDHCVYTSTRDSRDHPDVLPGSGILVPIAHRASPFDLTPGEWTATGELLLKAKAVWDERLAPDGYFLCWSAFPPSQADVRRMHAHLHVVPRFDDEPRADQGGRRQSRCRGTSDPLRPSPAAPGRSCSGPALPARLGQVSGKVEIREFQGADLDAIVEFSVRAWEPVFDSLRKVLGDPIFFRLYPDWQADQAEAVRAGCTNEAHTVFVAVAEGRPVGFSTVALNAFHEGMGVVDMIAVDPDYQRRGIAARLIDRSIAHMREHGMDIAAVGTGGDPGHAPARALYEAADFTPLPAVRYLKLIDEPDV